MININLEVEKLLFVFFRTLSMLWLLPIFQSRTIAAGYKAALSLVIAFLLYQSVSAPDLHGDPYLLLLFIGKEVLIGLAIGFFVMLLFAIVNAGAQLVSMQSGLSFARTMDPALGTAGTVLEQFQGMLTTMIFLGIDGHHAVLKALAVTLKEVPPGAVAIKPELLQFLVGATGQLFAASLKILAPVVVTLFLVDLGLGMLARMIPQVNVLVEGASIKILVTVSMLAISLNLIVPVIAGVFRGMDTDILRIIRFMG